MDIRGVQRCHYLYLFNQQNGLYLYLCLDRRPEVGVVYAGATLNQTNAVFSNVMLIRHIISYEIYFDILIPIV